METEAPGVGTRAEAGSKATHPEDRTDNREAAVLPNGNAGAVSSDGIQDAVESLPATDALPTEATPPPALPALNTVINPRLRPPRGSIFTFPSALINIDVDDRIGRVLLSAVLSLILWFYVVNLENPEQTTVFKGLSVEVRGAAGDIKILNPLPTVDAIVQAPQSVMANLRPSDVHPYVDLTGLSGGVHDIPIGSQVSGGPDTGASVTLSPGTVQLQLEAQVTRTFTVTVIPQGNPAFGFGLEPPQVNPDRVQVTGSTEAVSRIARVVVEVDVETKAGTQQGSKNPVALDSSGNTVAGLTFDPPAVAAVVPIKLLLNYKLVPVHVPVLGQPASGYRVLAISIDPTNVTVCCSSTTLDTLKSLDTTPVGITGTTSTVETTTQLLLPSGVDLYRGESRAISVTVSVEVLETTLQVSVAPTVEDLKPGLSAVVSPNKLDLTLAGTFAQLQDLRPSDIHAVLRAGGRGPGTYQLTPEIIVPQGVKLDAVTPDKVTVTLVAPTPVPPTATSTPQPTPTSTSVPATAERPVGLATSTRTAVASTPTRTSTSASTPTRIPPPPTPVITIAAPTASAPVTPTTIITTSPTPPPGTPLAEQLSTPVTQPTP